MISTKVLPEFIIDRVKRSKLLYGALRSVRFRAGSLLGARHVDGIPGLCHYNDFMLRSTSPEAVKAYHENAEKFVVVLADALDSVGKRFTHINSALDIGCGYGRIVRVLRNYMPPKRIYVCDVIEEGAAFTAKEFGVNAVPLIEEVNGMLDNKFDLIYMLSVYTHTPKGFMEEHIRHVSRCLRKGGICVFTTQGPTSADSAEQYNCSWLNKDAIQNDLFENGFSFQQYPHYYGKYGMTWCTPAYVMNTIKNADTELEFISHTPVGHGGHQDVFVYTKK